MTIPSPTPAEIAAAKTLAQMVECLDGNTSFRLEAGAGAGKTYSLVEALRHLISTRGVDMRRRHQSIACITYTNVACAEIADRIDGHPVVQVSTIHAFFWPLISPFQAALRDLVPGLNKWPERLAEIGGIGKRRVEYDLGYPRAKTDEDYVLLHHDDVISLSAQLFGNEKFRAMFRARYPVVLIDEYQDTNAELAEAIKKNLLGLADSPLIGLFGDHWQKIYGDGCGLVEHPQLRAIDKGANFRSAAPIVECLNRMRPELPQAVGNIVSLGSVRVFTTNSWADPRRTGTHWKDDLPEAAARTALDRARQRLESEGWSFAPEGTKILVLTHRVLAREQDYAELADVFQGSPTNLFIKKEDPYLSYLIDSIEPACIAYRERRFGDMLAALGVRAARIESHKDKLDWKHEFDALMRARTVGTIGDVVDTLTSSHRFRVPETIERREQDRVRYAAGTLPDDFHERAARTIKLRGVPYSQLIALREFIEGFTPYSTKHGVKGAEFENVLVVCGRGWNVYDFGQMLELAGGAIPASKAEFHERNRNLFYVACSRPTTRLALLFTQKLSPRAMSTLGRWFSSSAVTELA